MFVTHINKVKLNKIKLIQTKILNELSIFWPSTFINFRFWKLRNDLKTTKITLGGAALPTSSDFYSLPPRRSRQGAAARCTTARKASSTPTSDDFSSSTRGRLETLPITVPMTRDSKSLEDQCEAALRGELVITVSFGYAGYDMSVLFERETRRRSTRFTASQKPMSSSVPFTLHWWHWYGSSDRGNSGLYDSFVCLQKPRRSYGEYNRGWQLSAWAQVGDKE